MKPSVCHIDHLNHNEDECRANPECEYNHEFGLCTMKPVDCGMFHSEEECYSHPECELFREGEA